MAAVGAELTTYIVTPDSDVRSWAKSNNLGVLDDPGAGLNVASSLAVDAINGRPWMVAHADLPNVTAVSLTRVAEAAGDGTALVPSIDGGTNVIAHTGSFPFSFGPGSFHRHLASFPDAVVLPGAALSMDVDTPAHLVALARTGAAPSLSEG
jgi:2-phospho-L-lactate guanylyltransferase (CobY/MobA/RfbA family)